MALSIFCLSIREKIIIFAADGKFQGGLLKMMEKAAHTSTQNGIEHACMNAWIVGCLAERKSKVIFSFLGINVVIQNIVCTHFNIPTHEIPKYCVCAFRANQ